MNTDRVSEIKARLESNAYFINPHSDVHVADDIRYLLNLLAEKDLKLEQFQKKNDVLSQHVMELTQEIENVRSDFGNNR